MIRLLKNSRLFSVNLLATSSFVFFVFVFLNISISPQGLQIITPTEAITIDGIKSAGKNLVNEILFKPATAFAFGTSFAIGLIDIVTNPRIYNDIFRLDALFQAWSVVRDVFNIFFIFALLFSAFATIFQIQKYHIRTVLVRVLILAILINFSWTITRIIIDISQVLLFFFLGELTGPRLMATFASAANIEQTFFGEITGDDSTVNIIFVVISTFIFMITAFNIAFQLLLRPIILMVLLIFSPVGLAGSAIPQLRSVSDKWWEALIRNAFRGPILIFVLVFSVAITADFSSDISEMATEVAGRHSGGFEDKGMSALIASIVPLTIVWAGLIASRTIGDASADALFAATRRFTKRGTAVSLRTLGRGVDNKVLKNSGATVAGKFTGLRRQITNIDQRGKDQFRQKLEDSENTYIQNRAVSRGGEGNAVANAEKKRIAEIKDDAKKNLTSSAVLAKLADSKTDPTTKKALRELQAESKDTLTSAKSLGDAVTSMGNDFEAMEKLISNAASDSALKKITPEEYKKLHTEVNKNLTDTTKKDTYITDAKIADEFNINPSDREKIDKKRKSLAEAQERSQKELGKKMVSAGESHVSMNFALNQKKDLEGRELTAAETQKIVTEHVGRLSATDFLKQGGLHGLMTDDKNDDLAKSLRAVTTENKSMRNNIIKNPNLNAETAEKLQLNKTLLTSSKESSVLVDQNGKPFQSS